jgi:magnesium chelatase family protein
MLGGGSIPRPGEISLAHKGVLMLDELPEFRRDCLEALRQPLESGEYILNRTRWTYRFPAEFQLIGTANLCPCGNRGSLKAGCSCTDRAVSTYVNKISGPLFDRIDMCIVSSATSVDGSHMNVEDSRTVRTRVMESRDRQLYRGCNVNGMVDLAGLHDSSIEDTAMHLMSKIASNMNLSTRSQLKILRISRTIADLDCKQAISDDHVAEAIQYRTELRNL